VPQLLHLTRQQITRVIRRPQILGEGDGLHGQPAKHQHHNNQRQRNQPLSTRQPPRTSTTRGVVAHFDTTAQIAIAADMTANSTGTVN
jgi:hypothetical protein